MRTLALLPLLLAACTSPETEDLVGTWANLDGDTWRAWTWQPVGDVAELTGLPHTYQLYLYADGTAPVEVQRGTYTVEHGVDVNTPEGVAAFNDVLTTTVTWSLDGAGVGATYGDPIYAFTPKHVTIRSLTATAGRRTYDKVDTLP